MASGSVVVLEYDGNNITTDVLWSSVSFESQLNAVPGSFTYTVKDVNHVYSFITGKETKLTVDGTALFGGYVVQVERAFPFAAMDTVHTDPSDTARYFTIRGLDFNMLFDKRVMRWTSNYLTQFPDFPMTSTAGELIRLMCSTYLDIPAGYDTTTYVDDVDRAYEDSGRGHFVTQGETFRKQMDDVTALNGSVWYFDADKNLHHHAIESVVKRWGFSDKPNRNAITASPNAYQSATIGMREVNAVQKGDHKVHDAFVWGGSQWAGPPGPGGGGTVFARVTVAPPTGAVSYQYAETHFGELGWGTQLGVDLHADLIINGPPGAVAADQQRGLRYDQWNFRFSWFAHQVPKLSGVADHIRPGYISTITLETFGDPGALVQVLPLRTVRVTFPELDPTGKGYVRFDGMFGLQPDDPFSLWRFLLKYRDRKPPTSVGITVDGDPATVYGAWGSFTPTPVPNGAATIFTIPFGYIANTTLVYLFRPAVQGGILLRRGVDYTESDTLAGQITLLVTPPLTGEALQVDCRTLNS